MNTKKLIDHNGKEILSYHQDEGDIKFVPKKGCKLFLSCERKCLEYAVADVFWIVEIDVNEKEVSRTLLTNKITTIIWG